MHAELVEVKKLMSLVHGTMVEVLVGIRCHFRIARIKRRTAYKFQVTLDHAPLEKKKIARSMVGAVRSQNGLKRGQGIRESLVVPS